MAAAALGACSDEDDEIVSIDRSDPFYVESSNEVAAISQKEENNDEIRVYVCGAVKNPAVYSMTSDKRTVDAIDAAGGLTDDAGSDYINLAAKLSDGQKLYVPTKHEIEEALAEGEELYSSVVNITKNTPGAGSLDADGNATNSDGKVDINRADKATLMTLPGIGESKADKIIAYRESNGGFSSIEDIMLVGGIKEGLFNKVKDRICVGR